MGSGLRRELGFGDARVTPQFPTNHPRPPASPRGTPLEGRRLSSSKIPGINAESCRRWYENRSPEQRERDRARKALETASLTRAQRDVKNARRAEHRAAMTPEEIAGESLRAAIRNRDSAESRRRQRAEERARALAILGGCCNHCGIDDPIVLQFDHIEPLLPKTTGRSRNGNSAKLICAGSRDFQVLCANCHVRKSFENGEVFVGGGRPVTNRPV